MDQRAFEIKLSILIMQSLADGLRQSDLIKGLEVRLQEEQRLAESRRAIARSY